MRGPGRSQGGECGICFDVFRGANVQVIFLNDALNQNDVRILQAYA